MPVPGRTRVGRTAVAVLGLLAVQAGAGRAALASPRADAAHAYANGDYAQARGVWSSLAAAGDADAAYRLGLMSDLGQGTRENAADAFRWYRRAAEAGYAPAEFNVAVMSDSARGVPHNTALAAEWYARAATHGNHRAQYNLGLLYSTGDGVPRNKPVARAWFHLAAIGGLPAAADHVEALSSHPGTSGAPSASLRPVHPVAPRPGATLAPNAVEIVWTAPSQAVPVRFFLQVVARDGSKSREIYAAYTDATAALVHVAPGHRSYAWRVYTVSPTTADYSIGAWTAFTLRRAG
ncbi:tetratricopeptide repeat protein [Lichenicoccus sp.]|uniref:tetratricopeptide repeat protein n=1 Tax=Lichenicoccus sp. TaxID=2781899 RepID=UPI003D0DCC10